MGLSIISFKGPQVDFPNKCALQSLNIAFIIANCADSDEMQQATKLNKGFIPDKLSEMSYRERSGSVVECLT